MSQVRRRPLHQKNDMTTCMTTCKMNQPPVSTVASKVSSPHGEAVPCFPRLQASLPLELFYPLKTLQLLSCRRAHHF
ncbi:hypothetical protein CEXT_268351 [Caerostris extrusa]|uniref:Uncharacterized protein n=1 Tax=Caerostris extrusa TaxID=172846 RepID=A0AAV4UZN9_CAEEX|nr:hypothetical protein CEXT_268351 [Caerostris extrusa]